MLRKVSGSSDQPVADGVNRGVIMAAVQGVANAIMLAVHADVEVMATLNPVVTLFGFLAFGAWDRFVKPVLPSA